MPEKHYCYGSFCSCEREVDADSLPDIESGVPSSHTSLLSREGGRQKHMEMDRLADQASTTSEDSDDSAQAGVKRLEAIASTWTKTGLLIAYLGYVAVLSLRD